MMNIHACIPKLLTVNRERKKNIKRLGALFMPE